MEDFKPRRVFPLLPLHWTIKEYWKRIHRLQFMDYAQWNLSQVCHEDCLVQPVFSIAFSFLDTISLQKKVPLGTDRLKRLDSSTSLFQRQTSFITKKVTTLANKLVNPFANLKKKMDSSTSDLTTVDSQVDLRLNMKRQCFLVQEKEEVINPPRRTVTISSIKRAREDEEPSERRKVQVLSVNNEIRRPTGLFSYDEEGETKQSGNACRWIVRGSINDRLFLAAPVQTLSSKRFRMGATTSFLTRSLANHGLIE